MRNLLNPKWLFIINTIPILILFSIFYAEFEIIKSLLEPENIRLWWQFGIGLAILLLSNFVYASILIAQKKQISIIYGLISMSVYILFLYLYGSYIDEIIPRNVPRWMIPDSLFVYMGTFLMPTIAHALFITVAQFVSKNKERKIWIDFVNAFAIPLAWYVFVIVLVPFWRTTFGYGTFMDKLVPLFIITGTVLFLFFISKGIYRLSLQKNFGKYQLIWKILIALVFPLLGLALNNGLLFEDFNLHGSEGVFGNFTSIWFYVITVFNAALICLPSPKNKNIRLVFFIGKGITFSYTFYFFLVFIPFLPLSVVAIIAFGAGFLMLAPLALFIIHLQELSVDYKLLQKNYSKTFLLFLTLIGILVLPSLLLNSYFQDRDTLNQTLEYVYSPNYSKKYDIDKNSLSKTLNIVKQQKQRGNPSSIFGTQTPYLSLLFNWIVLDNLTLSDTKIQQIENIFFAKGYYQSNQEIIRDKDVSISNISTRTSFDKNENAWTTWLDLEITNSSDNRFSEYATTLDLPEGCWISDYYLYVGDKKEMGILAEKKAAMWIFSQIRNENKDPGLLYYLTGNKVTFRIFPFAKQEIRKTGIQFIHKEAITINIDGNDVLLGEQNSAIQKNAASSSNSNPNVIYISKQEKQNLETVQRTPYFHFIFDISKGMEAKQDDFTQRMNELLAKNHFDKTQIKISFANTYTQTQNLNSESLKSLENQTFEGGFYLGRAIKKILVNNFKQNNSTYPVIVVLSDKMNTAIIEKDFADFRMAFPESELFYNLDINGNLIPHSLVKKPNFALLDSSKIQLLHSVLKWTAKDNSIAYLPKDTLANVMVKNFDFELSKQEISEKSWNLALKMHGKWLSQIFEPQNSNEEWNTLVKYSFISEVMTPLTSYIVVENEAQKAILQKKQNQSLAGNQALDLGEDIQQMSEPELLIFVFLLGIYFLIKKRLSAVFNK